MTDHCAHTRQGGSPCKGYPVSGDIYCFFHTEGGLRAREAARKGGRNKRRIVLDLDALGIQEPTNINSLISSMSAATLAVLSGKLDPKAVTAAGYIGNILIRAFELQSIADRVARLEESEASLQRRIRALISEPIAIEPGEPDETP